MKKKNSPFHFRPDNKTYQELPDAVRTAFDTVRSDGWTAIDLEPVRIIDAAIPNLTGAQALLIFDKLLETLHNTNDAYCLEVYHRLEDVALPPETRLPDEVIEQMIEAQLKLLREGERDAPKKPRGK